MPQPGGIRRTDTPPIHTVTSALTNTTTTPPPSTSITNTLDSAPEAGKIHSSSPSCYAPLQLQNGIARQGGSRHSVTVARSHTVAPGEGLDSGDITKQSPPSSEQRKVFTQQVSHLKNRHRLLSLSSSQGLTALSSAAEKKQESLLSSEQQLKVSQHVDQNHHHHQLAHQLLNSPKGPTVTSASISSTSNQNNFSPCRSPPLSTLKESSHVVYKKRKSVIRGVCQ